MDERSFDNLLKRKLENYSDPHFDEEGFQVLKERFVARPRITQTATRMIYAATSLMVILTALNIYLTFFYEKTDQQAIQNKQTLLAFQTQIDSLTEIIHEIRYDQRSVIPSEPINVPYREALAANAEAGTVSVLTYDTSRLFIGRVNELLESTLQKLKRSEMISIEDGKVYINADSRNQLIEALSQERESNDHASSSIARNILPSITVKKVDPFNREISLSMRNKIEQHYFQGLGINLGIHVAPNLPSLSSENGLTSLKTGVLSDWIVSPRWSIEAGADYSSIRTRTNNASQIPEKFQRSPYGTFDGATISTSLVSFPLSLKYRQWVSPKTQAFVKVGYVPYFSFARRYKLNYDNGATLPDHDDYRGISQVGKEEARMFYSNNLSLGIGLTRQLKKGKLDVNLFYEKSVASNVQSANKLQLLGLSAGYWLRIK